MPVRKVGDKYFWGSKGPFNSRKKARQVAKAAYASGYRKKEMNEMPNPRMEDVHIDSAMGRMKKINKMLDDHIASMKSGKKRKSMKMGYHTKKDDMKKMMGHGKKDDSKKMMAHGKKDDSKKMMGHAKKEDTKKMMGHAKKEEEKKLMGMMRKRRYGY